MAEARWKEIMWELLILGDNLFCLNLLEKNTKVLVDGLKNILYAEKPIIYGLKDSKSIFRKSLELILTMYMFTCIGLIHMHLYTIHTITFFSSPGIGSMVINIVYACVMILFTALFFLIPVIAVFVEIRKTHKDLPKTKKSILAVVSTVILFSIEGSLLLIVNYLIRSVYRLPKEYLTYYNILFELVIAPTILTYCFVEFIRYYRRKKELESAVELFFILFLITIAVMCVAIFAAQCLLWLYGENGIVFFSTDYLINTDQ